MCPTILADEGSEFKWPFQTGRIIVTFEPDFVDVFLREDMVFYYNPSRTTIRRQVRKDVSLLDASEIISPIAKDCGIPLP